MKKQMLDQDCPDAEGENQSINSLFRLNMYVSMYAYVELYYHVRID